MIAIKGIAALFNARPNDAKPLSELYQHFTQAMLNNKCFAILRLAQYPSGSMYSKWKSSWGLFIPSMETKHSHLGKTLRNASGERTLDACMHNLATWVICWTCKALPVMYLPGRHSDGGQLDIMVRAPRYSSDHGSVSVSLQGIRVDEVAMLSSFDYLETDEGSRPGPVIVTTGINAYGGIEDAKHAFLCTLTAATDRQGAAEVSSEYQCLLDPLLWCSAIENANLSTFEPRLFMLHNRYLRLCGYTLEELLLGQGPARTKEVKRAFPQSFMATKIQLKAVSWMLNVIAWRRLANTKTGRIALYPAAASSGDKVAIILGCSTPMLLRPNTGGGWTLIGEVYGHCLMNGEALDLYNESHLDEIEIR